MFPDSHFQRKRLILNMINHLGPISRTSLIELTAYRPATVGAIVGELLEKQLIVESGSSSSGQGRKRIMLDMNKAHICGVGISFTPTHAAFLISQYDGTILVESELPLSGGSKNALVAQITAHLQQLLEANHDRFYAGIGICKPLIDPMSYRNQSGPDSDPRAQWIQDLLAPGLEAATGLPTQVFSAVTLPAQAEHRFGAAKGTDDFIWVELSNGIGTSIFSGGHAIGGADGTAGELGHTLIPMEQPARLCYCGKPGCVESVAAWPALIGDIRQALHDGVISCLQYGSAPEELTVQDIKMALDRKDPLCTHYVRRAARALGAAIANSVNLLNPRLIVLYGFMLELGTHFLQPLEQAIRENTVFSSGDFELRISTTSEKIMPLGAIANIFAAYLRMEDYRWVYQLDKTAL